MMDTEQSDQSIEEYNIKKLDKINQKLIQMNPCQQLDPIKDLDKVDLTVKGTKDDRIGVVCLRNKEKKFQYLGLINTQNKKMIAVDEPYWTKMAKK